MAGSLIFTGESDKMKSMITEFVPAAEDLPAGFVFTVDGVRLKGVNTDPLFNLCVQELKKRETHETWERMLTATRLVYDDEFLGARKRLLQFKTNDYELLKIRQTLWGASKEVFTEQEALYAIYLGFIIPAGSFKELISNPLTVKDEDGLVPVDVLTKISVFSRGLYSEGLSLRTSHSLLFGQFFTVEQFKELRSLGIKPRRVQLLMDMGYTLFDDVKEQGVNIPREWLEDVDDVRRQA